MPIIITIFNCHHYLVSFCTGLVDEIVSASFLVEMISLCLFELHCEYSEIKL